VGTRYGVEDPTIKVWIRNGFLHLDECGSGNHRTYPPGEVRAIRAIDAARRLGGIDPKDARQRGANTHEYRAQRYRFLTDIAEAARSNPAGSVIHIEGPEPWIRHVLIVPSED
jgi:hypothetical protein